MWQKIENTTWIMTIIYATGSNRKIPLGKEEWVDERCYYLDRLQNIPTQYQIHDLDPDQNDQSMTL